MMPNTVFCLILATCASVHAGAGMPSMPSARERRAAYYQSIVECREFGFDGVLITMTEAFVEQESEVYSTNAADGEGSVRDRIRAALLDDSDDDSDIFWNASKLIATTRARLSAASLEKMFDDDKIGLVEANCNLQINNTMAAQSNPPWGLDRLDQNSAKLDSRYDYGSATGAGTRVYVLDTGVRVSHNDFQGRAESGFSAGCNGNGRICSVGWEAYGVADASCSSHGTHCAGTIAGATYGVAKEATVVAVQVLSCAGSGSTSAIIEGLDWAVADARAKQQPAVVSMSLGMSGRSSTIDAAVREATAAGITVVVAAGNDNQNACGFSPASSVDAITVGATESSDARASYSNFGKCVDIYAPGSGVESASSKGDNAAETMSGTSMAAPHVAGAAALILAQNPGYSPWQVKNVINQAALARQVRGGFKALANGDLLHTETGGLSAFELADGETYTFAPATPPPPSQPPHPPLVPGGYDALMVELDSTQGQGEEDEACLSTGAVVGIAAGSAAVGALLAGALVAALLCCSRGQRTTAVKKAQPPPPPPPPRPVTTGI